jgi:peptidoglycan/xylan/chitin deacetylase (PgdA/CDA1 family)
MVAINSVRGQVFTKSMFEGVARPTPPPAPATEAARPQAPAEVPNAGPRLLPPTCRPATFKEKAFPAEHLPAGFYGPDKLAPGEVVLTFDDGPNAHTPAILDLLKKHGAKATFFVCGGAIDGNNYLLLRRMIAEGHTIGNHTWHHIIGLPVGGLDHPANVMLPDAQVRATIEREYRVNQAIVDAALTATSKEDFEAKKRAAERGELSDAPPLYPLRITRPTGGDPFIHPLWRQQVRTRFTEEMEKLGAYVVLWNAESADSDVNTPAAKRADPVAMAASVTRYLGPGGLADRNGALILLHDRIPVAAVETILRTLDANKDRQKVVALDQVLTDKYPTCLPQ